MNAQPPDPSARRDALVLALAATVLRGAAFRSLGLDHFDEGGYAMSAAALAAGDAAAMYPLQYFLSPPLFFGLAGALMRLLGSTSAAVLVGVSAVAGVGTVVATYLAGRRWFGRAAGGAAALALALSDFHILYSRAGLTDALFTGLFVVAVLLFGLAEEKESPPLAALAGLATGLAWNTKYHGWLAGVVAVAAVLPALAADRRRWKGTVFRLAVAGLVAVALYAPWLWYVTGTEGGYSRLAEEHALYLRPARAIQNALAQLRAQLYLEGWTARLAPAVLVGWVTLVHRGARRTASAGWAAALTLASVAVGATTVVGALALGGAVVLLLRHRTRPGRHWHALAYFAVFTLLTPLYFPYPRLLLPWLAAATLLAGQALVELLSAPTGSPVRRLAPAAVAAVMAAVIAATGARPAANPWRYRGSLGHAALEVAGIAGTAGPIVVIGEPAVVYYLRRLGIESWHVDRPADAERRVAPGGTWFMVGGIYSRRVTGPGSLESWLQRQPDAAPAGRAEVPDVSDVRLLDDFGPAGARRFRREPRGDYELRVYRVGAGTR